MTTTAPMVTMDDIQASIAETQYVNAGVAAGVPVGHPLRRMTLCFITTKSGFALLGSSACVSDENFNESKGQEIAYEDAVDQLWGLMGFALKERLAAG